CWAAASGKAVNSNQHEPALRLRAYACEGGSVRRSRGRISMTLQGRGSLTTISVFAAAFLIFGGNCGPAAAATSSSASALREIDAFAGALSGVSGYGATVTIYDQKDTQTQNVVFDYTFSKPSNVTVHVTGGPNTGVTLDWNGGSTVVAHKGSGLAAMFSKTLSLH